MANSDLLNNLTLRPLTLSDVDDILPWVSDDRVMRVHPHGPCPTKAQAQHLLNSFILPHPWYRAICINNHPIGSIGFKPIPSSDFIGRKVSIGYGIAYEFWGRGIATKAVKMAVATAMDEFPMLERIEATVEVWNVRSQRVVEKAGFVKVGVLRKYVVLNGESVDVVMSSFLRGDALVD